MKPLTGGLVGALVAGLAVFGWNARPGATAEPAWTTGVTAPSALHLVSETTPGTVAAASAPVPFSVQCEPGQRAVLRQVPSWNGAATTEAACVGETGAVDAMPGFVSSGVIDPVRARPVRYVSDERIVPERVVYRERPVRRAAPARSWKKRALVIGGSAGAGAGIGALAGGKKGALIGAAVGGGAGTIYELLKK